MANEEHIRVLKQGANVWNEGLAANPEVVPDLIGADLKKVNLQKAETL
jgi:hypothetical protein